MIVLAIEIPCRNCGAGVGESCKNTDRDHQQSHMISYSFCFERISDARKQTEASR